MTLKAAKVPPHEDIIVVPATYDEEKKVLVHPVLEQLQTALN